MIGVLAAGIPHSNFHQHGALFLFAMNGCMTLPTQADQVVRMIVHFILVYVMHMQPVSPMATAQTTKLARPLVSIFDLLAQAFPVRRIVPFGYAALPRGIVGTHTGAAQDKRFLRGTNGDAVVAQGNTYCSGANHQNVGYFIHRMLLDGIQLRQSLLINFDGACIQGGWTRTGIKANAIVARLHSLALHSTVMAFGISQPLAIFAYPLYGLAATASAQRSRAARLVDRLAGTTFACLGISASWIIMFFEQVSDVTRGAIKRNGDFFVGRIKTSGLTSPVVITDRQFFFARV